MGRVLRRPPQIRPATAKALASATGLVARAAKAEHFTGKSGSTLELSVPDGLKADRLVVIGTGKAGDLEPKDFLKFGGAAMGKLPKTTAGGTVFAELPSGAMSAAQAADLAQGAVLRAYAFDRYKTKRKDDEKPPVNRSMTIAAGDVAGARKAYESRAAIAKGVLIARDLVNEPGQYSLSGRIRQAHAQPEKSWRHGRGTRRQGHDQARHGRAYSASAKVRRAKAAWS